MRKNMQEVIEAWENGSRMTRPSCSTDGRNIYSYGTIILRGATDGRSHEMNGTKYSATTSNQQNAIRGYFARQNHALKEVTGIPMGARDF